MRTFVIAGGNSGVGLQTARELLAAGHRVIILGRDRRKGAEAVASFGSARDRATFIAADLSTHDGVRAAASQIDAITDSIDGIMHSAAAFQTKDVRTKDGIPVFFATGLSRYHLTQLLLPKLLTAQHPRVFMLTATMNETPKLDPKLFPFFKNFNFWTQIYQLNGFSLYYADYLMKQHPKVFAGCATPGFVRTGIFRDAPWFIKLYVALAAPFLANSVEKAAAIPVRMLLTGQGPSATNWNKPGDYDAHFAITVDGAVQREIMDACREVTGV